MKYKRKCPNCSRDISYVSQYNMKNAKEKQSLCNECCNIGQMPWNKGIVGVLKSNKKGKTNEELYGKEKANKIKNKLSKSLSKRKLTDEHKQNISLSTKGREITWGNKISESLSGRKLSKAHIESLIKNHKGMSGKKHSEKTIMKMRKIKTGKNNPRCKIPVSDETRKKQRISTIKYIKKTRNGLKCMVGKNETKLLDEQEKKNNIIIQRHYEIVQLGYVVDGYDEKNNIIYEVYEKYHKHSKQRQKDKRRQKEIINFLKCDFNIIWDL